MSETILRFGVELPEEVIPDNFFASLLFENLDFYVNHELITSKSSDSDYYTSNYVFLRDGFNESALMAFGKTEGFYETRTRDLQNYVNESGAITPGGRAHIGYKRDSTVEVTREGVKYYQYWFSTPINHGLARQDKPLPSGKKEHNFIFITCLLGIPLQLTFNRARSSKGLIQIIAQRKGKSFSYPEKTIPLISPTLLCYFVESEKADSFYSKSKLYDVELPFIDYSLRRELLTEGVAEHRVKLFEGNLPSVFAVMLVEPKVFDGSYEFSSVKFTRHNLESLEVSVDGTSLSSHPLKMRNGNSLDFYVDYLRRTNRFYNLLTSSCLTQTEFDDSNFITFVNLKFENFRNGQCAINLKFKAELHEKLFLLFMPITERRLRFHAYKNTLLI